MVLNNKFPPVLAVQKSTDLVSVGEGLLRGRVIGNSICVAGEPSTDELEMLLQKYKSVSGYYCSEKFDTRFDFYRAGTSSIIKRSKFKLSGPNGEEFRRSLRAGGKSRLVFSEVCPSMQIAKEIFDLESKWQLRHRGPKIQFILNQFRYPAVTSHLERWFIARKENGLAAFVSAIPYGGGYYFEHMIFDPKGPRMSLGFLLANSISMLIEEGVEEISLGFNPGHIYCPQNLIERTLKLSSHFQWPYNSKGILNFKRKFQSIEVPRFLYLDRRTSKLGQILNMVFSTYSFGSSIRGKSGEPFSMTVPSSESPHF